MWDETVMLWAEVVRVACGEESVRWAAYDHAQGSARDVPAMLRELVDAREEVSEWAKHRLWRTLWCDGVVYPVTALVVPSLLDLLDHPRADVPWLLYYLAHLAHGRAYLEQHGHLPCFDDVRDSPTFLRRLDAERDAVWRTHEAVARGIPRFLALLDDGDPHVRMYAAYALSGFPERGGGVRDALCALATRDEDEQVRASAALALACVWRDRRALARWAVRAVCGEESPLVRWALASVEARAVGAQLSDAALTALIDALLDPSLLERAHAPLPWADESVRAASARVLVRVSGALDRGVHAMLERARATRPQSSIARAEEIILRASCLSVIDPAQRALRGVILESARVWRAAHVTTNIADAPDAFAA